jgi:hypothetical protein
VVIARRSIDGLEQLVCASEVGFRLISRQDRNARSNRIARDRDREHAAPGRGTISNSANSKGQQISRAGPPPSRSKAGRPPGLIVPATDSDLQSLPALERAPAERSGLTG